MLVGLTGISIAGESDSSGQKLSYYIETILPMVKNGYFS
jgi:hypothetical protein